MNGDGINLTMCVVLFFISGKCICFSTQIKAWGVEYKTEFVMTDQASLCPPGMSEGP